MIRYIHRTRTLGLTLCVMLFAACASESLEDPLTTGETTIAPTDTTTALPTETSDAWRSPVDTFEVTVERTEHGVPHVTANDLGSLAFGQAYALAEDHVCTLADQMVQVRGERSRYFGPGFNDANIRNDFAILHLGLIERAEEQLQTASPESQLIFEGYAAGFNHYLEEAGLDGLPEICRGEDWVQPISDVELAAYYRWLALLGSARQLLPFIAEAMPPGAKNRTRAPLPPIPSFRPEDMHIGSNGWGLGAEETDTGRGMVIGNPHFPWEGELRLHESHLTIPGHLDVYGASLIGVAGILIGFNEHVSWTHTVSFAPRFTAYRLELDPEDELRYRYGDEWRDIEAQTYEIEVRQEDGSTETIERTLYRSHYGPMVEFNEQIGWNTGLNTNAAITYRDANLENDQLLEQFFQMNRARSLDEFIEVNREIGGIPWVNTMAATAEGEAFYADASVVPNVSEEAWDRWRDRASRDIVGIALDDEGVILLDGSDPEDEWVDDDSTRIPGIVPFDEAPSLRTDTYIFNANDSHWLTNVETPLEGYHPIFGPERSPRSMRTRMNAKLLTEDGPESFRNDEGLFSHDALRDMIYANRLFSAELMLDDILERCEFQTEFTIDDETVETGPGCDILADWDRRADLQSTGAVLWREVIGSLSNTDLQRRTNWRTPFDADDPVYTPRDYGPEDPLESTDNAVRAVAQATARLESLDIPLDATLDEYQFTIADGERIPIHGGLDREGGFQIVGLTFNNTTLLPVFDRGETFVNGLSGLWDSGYPINFGGSFIMVASFTDDGPIAHTVLTYSQSDDERTPWTNDQTYLYSQKEWKQVRFTREDIESSPELEASTFEVPVER